MHIKIDQFLVEDRHPDGDDCWDYARQMTSHRCSEFGDPIRQPLEHIIRLDPNTPPENQVWLVPDGCPPNDDGINGWPVGVIKFSTSLLPDHKTVQVIVKSELYKDESRQCRRDVLTDESILRFTVSPFEDTLESARIEELTLTGNRFSEFRDHDLMSDDMAVFSFTISNFAPDQAVAH